MLPTHTLTQADCTLPLRYVGDSTDVNEWLLKKDKYLDRWYHSVELSTKWHKGFIFLSPIKQMKIMTKKKKNHRIYILLDFYTKLTLVVFNLVTHLMFILYGGDIVSCGATISSELWLLHKTYINQMHTPQRMSPFHFGPFPCIILGSK